jgi:hypothetical protein
VELAVRQLIAKLMERCSDGVGDQGAETCYEAKKRSCSTCCTTSQVLYDTMSFGKCAPPCRVLLLQERGRDIPKPVSRALVYTQLGVWARPLTRTSPRGGGSRVPSGGEVRRVEGFGWEMSSRPPLRDWMRL